jgi:RNA polymerase sigma-70 factor (ECF subfamily)
MRPEPGMPSGDFHRVLRAATGGDEPSWQALYSWLAPQVLGFLRAGRVSDPEDVLGDVFLEVARRISQFRGDERGFRAWVFTIARARRVDGIRREVRHREVPSDLVAHEAVSADIDVEGEALALVGLDELLSLLDHLTDDQSEVLILKAIGGWSAREVGEITGRSTGSVEQLQHRATRALRELLAEA